MKTTLAILAFILSFNSIQAQDDSSFDISELTQIMTNDSIIKSFTYQTGSVVIGDNLATVKVPKGCLFIGPIEAKILMEDIYGNPPSEPSLGMLLSDTPSVMGGIDWIIDINYYNEGHINDDDAKDINYDDLLKQLKEEAEQSSIERVKLGYEKVKMIGWAQTPFYDEKNKKLHWAKELAFGTDEENTLNYNIRVLGREGFIEMNIITGMSKLSKIKKDIEIILHSTDFNPGQRYADFNEDTDKLAEYGIGGLIAGGVLAKTGILAKIGVFLLKIIKPLIIGVIALFAFIGKKFFNKKKIENTDEKNEIE